MAEASQTPRPLLEAKGISVTKHGVPILREVAFEASAGEVVALLGPSGAGKTSLFRVVAGEESPVAGRVFLDGVDVTGLALWLRARMGIGYLPQSPSVLFDLTVQDNLATYASVVKRPMEDVVALADKLELRPLLSVRARDLSGGERRRLEITRALCARPRILICDEPFSGVDPAGGARIATVLRQLACDEKIAIVLSDHHTVEALAIAHRVVLLVDGVVEMTGTPEEFARHPVAQGRYLGGWRSGESIPPSVNSGGQL